MRFFQRYGRLLTTAILSSILAACGGGGSSGGENTGPKTPTPQPVTYDVQGVGVKGPMQHAEAVLYRLDLTAEDSHGEELGRGTTNQQAQLEGLSLTGELEGNFLLEFNVTQDTTDLTTGKPPVISRLMTIIDAEAIMAGDIFYATPLSTLAVLLVFERDPAANKLTEAMTDAQQDVKSIVGLDASVDLFNTPPVLTESADTPEASSQLVRLRVAIEAMGAIVYNLQAAGENDEVSSTDIMVALASDLADGVINAKTNGEPILAYDADSLEVFLQPLRELTLPNTGGKNSEDVVAILLDETQSLGNSHIDTTTLAEQVSKPRGPYFMRTVDTDGDGINNHDDQDDDNDGTPDVDDGFPNDSSEQADSDADGVGNNADDDDDNDGVSDVQDAFPENAAEWLDTDSDGQGNNDDIDDDNDGYDDGNDTFPLDAGESRDFDGDLMGDNADLDDDNDGVYDSVDKILVTGQRRFYSPGEFIEVRAKAGLSFGVSGNLNDGWAVQYYTYDVKNSSSLLTDYTNLGYYNASYDSYSGEWLIRYPAPDYHGLFKTRVSLFCSTRGLGCNGKKFAQEDQRYYFNVTCPGQECQKILDPAPGVYITNSVDNVSLETAVRRSNGDLIAISTLRSETEMNTIVSRSRDDGETWRTIRVLGYGSGGAKLIETSSGQLVVIQKCDSSLCLFRSYNGVSWRKQDLLRESDFLDCHRRTCDLNSISIDSIIEAANGSFVVSFGHDAELGSKFDVYVSTTHDFSHWSTPTRITSGDDWEFESSLVQLSDGTFVLALVSYTSGSIEIYSSLDGLNWPYSTQINTSVWAHMRLNWLVEGDQARLFFASSRTLYSSLKVGEHLYDTAPVETSSKPFGGNTMRFPDGSIGLAFTLVLNNQRDVFFTNLGKL